MKLNTHVFKRIREKYQNRSEPENVRALATVYWHIVTRLAALAIVLICIYGAFELMWVSADLDASSTSGTKSPSNVSREQLDLVIAGFDARQAHFESLGAYVPGATSTATTTLQH